MLGEVLSTVAVTERGLMGDRIFAVLDEAGAVGSAKHPRKWGPLLSCRSRMAENGVVQVELPDGTVWQAGAEDLDEHLSELLSRRVSVSDVPPEQGSLERAVPEYEGGVPEAARERAFVDETGDTITSGGVAPGTFFDFGMVHLVTTPSLDHLRSVNPAEDFDASRFRPNLVIDVPGGPGFPEDAWQVPVFDLGRLSCVGVYLDVLEPGEIKVGDVVVGR